MRLSARCNRARPGYRGAPRLWHWNARPDYCYHPLWPPRPVPDALTLAESPMRRIRLSTLALALALAPLAACGDGLGGLLISYDQELEIGAGVDLQMRQDNALIDPSDPVSAWAAELVAPLAQASSTFRDPAEIGGYKVAVIADDELVNAFAGPGGFTYISTGLILQAESCAEIAGVMGHELGHVTERHGVKQLEAAYAVSVISNWFLGEGLANDAAQTIYLFFQSTQFSQDHESEADSVGLQIAFGAGYNPFGLVDFFAKLLALQGSIEVPEFLSSHPPTDDRIAASEKEIQRRYGATVVEGTTQTYGCVGTALTLEQVKARILGGVTLLPGTGQGAAPAIPATP